MKRVIALALLALATSAQTPAPQPLNNSTTQPPPTQPGQYVGVASCANSGCHGSTLPLQSTRVLQNEFYTWLNNDRHAKAYNVLFDARSARIIRNMRLKKKAYQETLCLDCHSTNVNASLISGRIDKEDGVQCEACHGPASGWRAEHTQAGWTHEQSVARGMIDLRSISTRATSCHACHLGTKNKEVDHELIASGHPVLQFELDNYTETMPAHWTAHKDTHGIPAWATGQAVAFRDSLDNLARHARGEKWPEFSDMSCYNCHHSLESSGWRQERGWPSRAGLPAWGPQRWAVLRLIVTRVAPSSRAQLDDAVQQLASRVSRMNDASGVAAAADDARRLIEPAIAKIAAASWNDDDVRAMMRTLTSDDNAGEDVHSAEQTALALQSLAAHLKQRKSSMSAALDALFAEVKNRDRYEPSRFAQKLREVRAAL
jgi:hypothetical protein